MSQAGRIPLFSAAAGQPGDRPGRRRPPCPGQQQLHPGTGSRAVRVGIRGPRRRFALRISRQRHGCARTGTARRRRRARETRWSASPMPASTAAPRCIWWAPCLAMSMSTKRRSRCVPRRWPQALEQRPAAVIVTHLYGQLADIESIASMCRAAGRSPDRGLRAGPRRAARRQACGQLRRYRLLQLLSHQEPGRDRRRRRGGDAGRQAGRPGARAAAIRLVGEVPGQPARRPQQPPGRASGGGPAGKAAPPGSAKRPAARHCRDATTGRSPACRCGCRHPKAKISWPTSMSCDRRSGRPCVSTFWSGASRPTFTIRSPIPASPPGRAGDCASRFPSPRRPAPASCRCPVFPAWPMSRSSTSSQSRAVILFGGGGQVLTLVIPVYRNEGSLPDLLDAVAGLAETLDGQDGDGLRGRWQP